MRTAPVRADALLERTLLLLDPVAAQRGMPAAAPIRRHLPAFLADPDLLSRAVENLVSNAIKYSPAGAEIVSPPARDEECIVIEVADQGYGIPEAISAASSKSSTGFRAWRMPRRRARDSASPLFARSPSCITGTFPCAARSTAAPLSPFGSHDGASLQASDGA